MKFLKGFIFFVILFVLAFFIGKMSVKDVETVDIYLEGEEYTFRDESGHRLEAIKKDGTVYLPLIPDYLFLDYSVLVGENEIELVKTEYPDYVDINTKTLEGASFTTENLFSYDFTILFNWAIWCPDCKVFLENYSEYQNILKENNIQFVGLPVSKDKSNIGSEVDKLLKDLNIDFENLVVTEEMKKQLQSNISNIPSVIVLDDKGKIVYSNEDINLLFETVFKDIESLDLCNEC